MGGISLSDEQSAEVDQQMKKTEAIIDSMTKAERNDHKILDASRKTRIAGGSGTTIAEVNQLLRQYEQMRKMVAQLNKGGLFSGLGRKALGSLAGGLGGMSGLGGGIPGLPAYGGGDDQPVSTKTRKKKRHKKRK
jgi:signal recognition particle subunit SRP54